MNKKNIFILTLIAFIYFSTASNIFALDSAEDTALEPTEKMETETEKSEINSMMKEERTKTKAEIEKIRMEEKTKREELREEIKKNREEAKAEMEQKREELKSKLSELKDQKKATIVERVDAKLSEKKTMIIDKLLGHLDRMSAILDRIEEKLSPLSGDKTEVERAISDARAAITDARTALSDQTATTYTIEITDESSLKTDVSTVVSQFREDLQANIEIVKKAKEATITASKALAEFHKANSSSTDTSGESGPAMENSSDSSK